MTQVTHKVWLSLLLLSLLATGCGSLGRSNTNQYLTDNAKYYTGKDGVEVNFQNFPQRLYYYGPDDNSGNEFSFGVEIKNQGASYSRGGVYVSGFDPNMLVFREIPIHDGSLAPCGLSFGNIGYGEYGGILRCDGVEVSNGGGSTNIRIDSLAELVTGLHNRFGTKQWLDPEKFDFSVNYNDNPTGSNFMINVRDVAANVEYYQNGRLFIALLAGVNFALNGGREFLLAGDTYEFPGGEYDYLTYNGKIVDWPPGLDQTQQKLLLTSCYQYTTYADPVVCIDPEPQSDNRKVCQPKSHTWGSGNGAPVTITSVEQENTPKKVIFRINVKNIGGGTVYDAGQLAKCSPYYPGRATPQDLNVVYLGDVRVGQVGLGTRGGKAGITCSPEVIRLDPKTGAGSTTCTYPLQFTSLKSAYQTPLSVELWYGYSKVLEKTVTIKRVV